MVKVIKLIVAYTAIMIKFMQKIIVIIVIYVILIIAKYAKMKLIVFNVSLDIILMKENAQENVVKDAICVQHLLICVVNA
jgi:hypothetical protein